MKAVTSTPSPCPLPLEGERGALRTLAPPVEREALRTRDTFAHEGERGALRTRDALALEGERGVLRTRDTLGTLSPLGRGQGEGGRAR